MKHLLWLFVLFCMLIGGAAAQDDCSALVQTAFDTTAELCTELVRNQACYGNVLLEVETRPDAAPITFEQAGDIADLSSISGLRLSAMNTETGVWGLALLRLQANLPDTLPGQNVTLVLFGDVTITDASLPLEEQAGEPAYTPMQAFYFTSAIGDAPCAEAPDSGILIQTPQGLGTINLLVNGVEIDLGSTAYLQARPDSEMLVNILEGQALVSAFDTSMPVPAGSLVRIPLDADGRASGPPAGPEPYNAGAFSALPLTLLPDEVSIAPALSAGSKLQEGDWTITTTACVFPTAEAPGYSGMIRRGSSGDGAAATWLYDTPADDESPDLAFAIGILVELDRWEQNNPGYSIPGNYTISVLDDEDIGTINIEFTIESSIRITGTHAITIRVSSTVPEASCTQEFTLEAVGAAGGE